MPPCSDVHIGTLVADLSFGTWRGPTGVFSGRTRRAPMRECRMGMRRNVEIGKGGRPGSAGAASEAVFAHRASPLSLSRGFYTFLGTLPTHTDSPRQSGGALAKSLTSYVSGSRSRYVARGGRPCLLVYKKRRVVESVPMRSTYHVGTIRIRSRHAVHGSWTALAGPAPLRRRRRAETRC